MKKLTRKQRLLRELQSRDVDEVFLGWLQRRHTVASLQIVLDNMDKMDAVERMAKLAAERSLKNA